MLGFFLKNDQIDFKHSPQTLHQELHGFGFWGARRLRSTFEFSKGLSLVPIQVKQVKGSW